MKKLLILPAAAALLLSWGCKDDPAVSVTGVQLDRPDAVICLYNTLTLQATVVPGDAANKTLQWSSSDPGRVDVDANGVITADAYGSATITVRTEDGGFTASCVVEVPEICISVAEIPLSSAAEIVEKGDEFALEYTVLPTDAVVKDVTVEVENPKIASALLFVDAADGNKTKVQITALFGGETDIRLVAHNGVDTVFHLTVPPTPLNAITFPSDPATVTHLHSASMGDSYKQTLTAIFDPLKADVDTLYWENLSPDILEFVDVTATPVTAAGNAAMTVVGKRPGDASVKVTAYYNGVPVTKNLAVKVDTSYVTNIQIDDNAAFTMVKDDKDTLKPVLHPRFDVGGTTEYFMTDKTVKWESTPEGIVSVENVDGISSAESNNDIKASYGALVALSSGTATVTGTVRTAKQVLTVVYTVTVVAGQVTVLDSDRAVAFDNTGDSKGLTVEANTDWTATVADSPGWCTVTPGGTGDGTLNISVTANSTGGYRRAFVSVLGGMAEIRFIVEQTPGAIPTTAEETGVPINGVTWATRFVEKPGEFAASPESFGMLYQWGRKTAWSAAAPSVPTGTGEGQWNSSNPGGSLGATWPADADPCPAGWRLPTTDELANLQTESAKTDATVQVMPNTPANFWNGTFVGPNAADSDISAANAATKGCLYLPNLPNRTGATGVLSASSGAYATISAWTANQSSDINGRRMMVTATPSPMVVPGMGAKTAGYAIRCVKE